MKGLSARSEGIRYPAAYLFEVGIVVIRVPRPEEASQTVSGATGNHVDVEMGNALADLVVGCDE